jgi:hypothetical protein
MLPGTDEPTGGEDAESGWSVRLMWRRRAGGELYLYIPKDQDAGLLEIPPESHRNGKYGLSGES